MLILLQQAAFQATRRGEVSLGCLTAGSERAGGMTSLHALPPAHSGYVLGVR